MDVAKGFTIIALALISTAVGGITVILTYLATDRRAALVLLLVAVLLVGTLLITADTRRLKSPYW